MITLYHHGSSVCAAKVRIVLAEKSVPWDGVYVDILRGDQFAPDYVQLNAKAVVPTLVHDGKVVIESTVIAEYLDEVFPAPSLKPADPLHRAAMRVWKRGARWPKRSWSPRPPLCPFPQDGRLRRWPAPPWSFSRPGKGFRSGATPRARHRNVLSCW